MSFSTERTIRFDDVDAAGILYYPRFFDFCHNTFEECFDVRGPFRYAELIREHRIGFPTVKIESDFRSPLAHGDVALIRLSTMKLGNRSLESRYVFERKLDGQVCFEGAITTVCMNLDTRKAVPLPASIRDFFEGLKR